VECNGAICTVVEVHDANIRVKNAAGTTLVVCRQDCYVLPTTPPAGANDATPANDGTNTNGTGCTSNTPGGAITGSLH
jgi:hypothetical protein